MTSREVKYYDLVYYNEIVFEDKNNLVESMYAFLLIVKNIFWLQNMKLEDNMFTCLRS